MPVKKKITKKPIKKPVKKSIKAIPLAVGTDRQRNVKQKQSQKQSVSQRQNVVVNVHTGKSASQDKSSTASKAKRVIPMPNYQPSESPYPSYVRQSAVAPVEAGNPGFASIGQTIGPIQNRIPVFADTAKPPVNPPEDAFVQYPKEDVTTVTEKPVVTKKPRKSKKTVIAPVENIPVVVSNIGIESESGIANIFTPVQDPAGLKAGGAFSALFPSVGKQPSPPGSFKLKPPPPLPKERTRKTPTGSRRDLEERYFMATGNRWPKVEKQKQKDDLVILKQTVEDQEAKVAR